MDRGSEQEVAGYDRSAMFSKVLTPSDVGKLNRLVIPKQQAEKHFPMSGDAAGTLLALEDEDEEGKCWRFRYSYWNSSQSYVLTKGWSRYVKDKTLQPGDVICFHRHRTQPQRIFIGCRRRQGLHAPPRQVVRLFGVNFECQLQQDNLPSSSSPSPSTSYQMSLQHQQLQQVQHQAGYAYYSTTPPSYHLEMNQMGNGLI